MCQFSAMRPRDAVDVSGNEIDRLALALDPPEASREVPTELPMRDDTITGHDHRLNRTAEVGDRDAHQLRGCRRSGKSWERPIGRQAVLQSPPLRRLNPQSPAQRHLPRHLKHATGLRNRSIHALLRTAIPINMRSLARKRLGNRKSDSCRRSGYQCNFSNDFRSTSSSRMPEPFDS